jgi:hypothetical protein
VDAACPLTWLSELFQYSDSRDEQTSPHQTTEIRNSELHSCTYTYTTVAFRELNPKSETTLGT